MKKILKTLTFCFAFLAVCVVFAGCTGGSDNQDLIDRLDAIDQRVEQLENPEVPAEVKYVGYYLDSSEPTNAFGGVVNVFFTLTETTLVMDMRNLSDSTTTIIAPDSIFTAVFDLSEENLYEDDELGSKVYILSEAIDADNSTGNYDPYLSVGSDGWIHVSFVGDSLALTVSSSDNNKTVYLAAKI